MTDKYRAKTAQGKHCGSYSQIGSSYCFIHDPKKADKRRQALKLGGKNSRQAKRHTFLAPHNVKTTKGLVDGIAALISETSKLGHSVKRDQVIGQLMKVQGRLIYQYQEEKGETDARHTLKQYYIDALRDLDEDFKEAKKQVESELAKKILEENQKSNRKRILRLRPNSPPFADY